MLEREDIFMDPTFKEFLDSRNLKPSSIRGYEFQLLKYCNLTGLKPTEIIEEAEQEEEDRIRMKNRKIKKYFNGFIKLMMDDGTKPGTIRKYVSGVRTFYSEFEIELPKNRYRFHEDEELVTIKDIPDKNDIKKALKYASIKYKAIIMLMMSSGMGSAEIRNLTLKDYIDAHKLPQSEQFNIHGIIENLRGCELEIPTWSIRRVKTGMPYVTFSSPESNLAINDYLEDRIDRYNIESENEYLFHNFHVYKSEKKRMTENAFVQYFKKINEDAGFGKYNGQIFFKSHNLRKYFASTLKNNGMDSLDAEWLIGHKVPKMTSTYIKPDIHRLKKDYMDILPELSISPVRTVTLESDEYKKLKEEYEIDSKAKEEKMAKMKDDYDEKLAVMERRLELIAKLGGDKEYNRDIIEESD